MKKFIALALTLAMLVSCLVFTASADASGVVVRLEGPANIVAGAEFQVKVRVTDPNCLVGGVQGVLDVTGADFVSLEANPDLKEWNNTNDESTIYKVADNDVTFAALNSLEATSYATRLWFIVNYKAKSDAEDVSVALKNVKASDKSANLISDVDAQGLDSIEIVDPENDPYIAMNTAGLLLKAEANVAMKQGIVINSEINVADADVAEFGVVFYPTSLLKGAELTIGTEGAVIAKAVKGDGLYKYVTENDGKFDAILKFAFNSEESALRFLGTRVTARSYYKLTDGTVVYASNDSVEDTYVKSGTANKAVLNVVLDNGGAIETPVEGDVTKDEYNSAIAGLTTSNTNWQANRATALKYVVDNYVALANK